MSKIGLVFSLCKMDVKNESISGLFYWDLNLEFQMLVALRNITNYLSDGTEFCIRERQTSNAFKLNNIETLKKLCPKFNLKYRIIVK